MHITIQDTHEHPPSRIHQDTDSVTAFISIGNRLVEAGAYRATYMDDLRSAYRGFGLDDETLKKAAGASATAYACIHYIADTVKSLPVYVGDMTGAEVDHHPLWYFLMDEPNLVWHVAAALVTFGQASLIKWYNAAGYPTRLQFIVNTLIEPRPARVLLHVNSVNAFDTIGFLP